MDLKQYKQFKSDITERAQAILDYIKLNYHTGNGLYYDTADIIDINTSEYIKLFTIQALKQLEVEFFDNNTLWRY